MGLINIDIDLLRTLIVVSEVGNFTTAGERLLRTQSAISLQVKRLEDVIGEKLFNREKVITLTSAGEMVKSYAIDILNVNDKLVSRFEGKTEKRVIKIGTPDDYAQLFLPSVIREFSKLNDSDVEFQIVSDLSSNLVRMALEGEIDIAFVTRTAGIDGIRLVSEPLCWVAQHGYQPDNDTLNLALFPDGCEVRRLATSCLDRQRRRWKIAFSSNQFAPLRLMISSGNAIGVLPTRAVPKDLMRIGSEFGLPDLPCADLLIKLAPQAGSVTRNIGLSIAHSLGSNRSFGEHSEQHEINWAAS